jgi:soluble lytic murein transglycosylase-like protein
MTRPLLRRFAQLHLVCLIGFSLACTCAADILGEGFQKGREIIRNSKPSTSSGGSSGHSGGGSGSTGTARGGESQWERERREAEEARAEKKRREAEKRARDAHARNAEAQRARQYRQYLDLNLNDARTHRPQEVENKSHAESASVIEDRRHELDSVFSVASRQSTALSPPMNAISVAELTKSTRAGHIRDAILSGKNSPISVADAFDAKADPTPWYQRIDFEQVTISEHWISEAAAKTGVDPDLLRAIIWMESTHGWYDELIIDPEARKTPLPMNLYISYWHGLGGYSDQDVRYRRDRNIEAGSYLLKELWQRTDKPSIEKVATLYHNVGDTAVSNYGKTVDYYYKNKPWKQPHVYRTQNAGMRSTEE